MIKFAGIFLGMPKFVGIFWGLKSGLRPSPCSRQKSEYPLGASALLKMLKFLVKVFKSLYLLNLWIDLVDTLPDVRYWSEVLRCTITTHISDLEVKVTDFEILS